MSRRLSRLYLFGGTCSVNPAPRVPAGRVDRGCRAVSSGVVVPLSRAVS